MAKSETVMVTYRRMLSGRTFQVRFELGPDNDAAILREAWNTRSEIISVSR